MILLSMTATFGCLDGKTLRLTPGLSIVTAPNEWGKSTWCAFLMAMLYGVDTRQRTRQGMLADKDRYRPWSGKPMSGSVTLLWQGREITIERSTQGRVPMGHFRAYEADSGLAVTELTGENCGLMLLGVERSVYARSGFISGTSLFSGPDADLSRRLNQLVTTGDESPAMRNLEEKLRDLKNKCQYHKTGALPQTREALRQCAARLEQQQALQAQSQQLRQSLSLLLRRQDSLSAHLDALLARENGEKLAQVEKARQAERQAEALLSAASAQCQALPSMEQLRRKRQALDTLEREKATLELEAAMLPELPSPAVPECFAGMSAAQAEQTVHTDLERLRQQEKAAQRKTPWLLPVLATIFGFGGAAAFLGLPTQLGYLAGGGLFLLALVLFGLFFYLCGRRKQANRSLLLLERELEHSYGGKTPEEALRAYQSAMDEHRQQALSRTEALTHRLQTLREQALRLGLDRKALAQAEQAWSEWSDAKRGAVRAATHRAAMERVTAGLSGSSVGDAPSLSLTLEQTQQALEQVTTEAASIRSRLDVCQGQSHALPSLARLEEELAALRQKETALLQWYDAIDLALRLLEQSRRELQGRFAPQLSRIAGEILSALTQGSYDRLLLQQDLTLLSPGREDTARESHWRSQGTQEQMYLALRLALSKLLIPDAPVILDDALAKFDDQRMAAALTYLSRQDQQTILFSCQGREAQWQKGML